MKYKRVKMCKPGIWSRFKISKFTVSDSNTDSDSYFDFDVDSDFTLCLLQFQHKLFYKRRFLSSTY